MLVSRTLNRFLKLLRVPESKKIKNAIITCKVPELGSMQMQRLLGCRYSNMRDRQQITFYLYYAVLFLFFPSCRSIGESYPTSCRGHARCIVILAVAVRGTGTTQAQGGLTSSSLRRCFLFSTRLLLCTHTRQGSQSTSSFNGRLGGVTSCL